MAKGMQRLFLLPSLFALACGSSTSAPDAGGKDTSSSDGPFDGPPAAACGQTMTTYGPVLGQKSGKTCAYEGIPFAAPPTGDLRWKAPQPPKPWTTPRPSTFGSGCPQSGSPFGDASTDEDCLYLNVWTPPPQKTSPLTWGKPRPAMVFVYGGGFVYGSGSYPLYDGTHLAASTDNIVVTIDYRLGPFGFLSNPALRAEDPHGSAGDYGIMDQIAAFQWVKDNIEAFGGDPQNVTIFGESAGGSSMFIHLASPLSKGLFEHVIIESGWAPYDKAALSQSSADTQGAAFATAVGCVEDSTLLTCMRGKSAAAILAQVPSLLQLTVTTGFSWMPVLDGYAIPKDPISAITSGSLNHVPTLLGNNADEGRLFLFTAPPTNATTYLALEEGLVPGHGAEIVAEYPIASYGGSYLDASAAALTDSQFLCPTRKVARGLLASGVPTYRYDFTHAISFLITGLGAFHGSELPFVFGNKLDGVALQPDEEGLSRSMMGYWGAMAASGDPNRPDRFAWPKYTLPTEPEIVLDLKASTVTELEKVQCDFWEGLDAQ
jgi:para-nitrobenzyl esterase